MKKRRTSLVLASVLFIIASLVLSTTNTIYKVISPTYAQTNAAALTNTTTLAANLACSTIDIDSVLFLL
jgi:hypothetical protein